jgi:hypothetical protein
MKKHRRSKAHQYCKDFNVRNSNYLPSQNQRQDEKVSYKPSLENPLCSNEVEIEITDEMKSKMVEIFASREAIMS